MPFTIPSLYIFCAIGISLSLSSCSSQHRLAGTHALSGAVEDSAANNPVKIQQLENDLTILLGHQDGETLRLAQTALHKTNALLREYEITGFPLFHNFLVNLGVKNRGLCCHWTEDLLTTLNDMKLEQYRFVWVVSNYGSFREHSSVAVVPVQKELKDSLILDPWRNAGRLYWSRIDQDSYDWQPHPGYKGINGTITCETNLGN